jgi:ParB-like chromosome segregation protein Spo0J
LLDLPAKVQVMVGTGQLSMGHARALITAPIRKRWPRR